jgi:uncharacterized membrane protein YraQ (UPF0718 family)
MTELALTARKVVNFDRVILAILALLVIIAVVSVDQLWASLSFATGALTSILPFLALSVLIAGTAKGTSLDGQIARVFKGHSAIAVVMAAMFGAAAPFCSCGVIPIVAALLAAGVPLAPVMAFWLASPIMSPSMFLLMLSVFGPAFTLAKAIAAVSMGLIGGFATYAIVKRGGFEDPLRGAAACCGCSATSVLDEKPVVLKFWKESERRDAFMETSRESAWFLIRWMTLAFLLESLMVAYVPAEVIGQSLGANTWWAIPASVLIGVPAYLNGFAAIPTVSAMMEMGMVPGAALGFMLAGGVTSIPAAIAVYALVKRSVFVTYIALGVFGSLALSYALQPFLLG